MNSNRLLSIALATAILCSSIAVGAVPIGADESDSGYPAGYAADRIDASRAIDAHHRAVTSSASVHTTLSYEATANGGASVRTVESWTNFTRDAQLLSAEAVYNTAQRYVADGVRYTNTSVSYNDGASYNRTPGDLLVGRATGREVLKTFLPYLDFSLRNASTVDGQRRFTYEATGFDADSFGIYTREVAEVRDYDATLVVDEQGRIREFEFTLDAVADDGNPLTVELSLELDGFGDTTVERPDWVREEFAQNESVNGTVI